MSSSQDTSVSLKDVSHRYTNDAIALEKVTFEVHPGRVLGLLGRNGAGKSTALRILVGLTRPTTGTASILGSHYSQLTNAARRVGTSFDDYGALTGASGPRTLSIWASAIGVPQRRVKEVLDLVGLSNVGSKKVTKYSSGMQQRLNLGVALLADPEAIILDEPANGLDPEGIRWLRDLLQSLAADGRTVIVSSHLLAEVEQTVEDVVILQQSVRYSGSLSDLTNHGKRRLEEAFFDVVGEKSDENSAVVNQSPKSERR